MLGTTEKQRLLERRRRKVADNINIDFTELGRDRVDWIRVAQDTDLWRALADTIMNFAVS